MGLFKKVFKKKPGGTFFGNLIRSASNLVPGVGAAYNAINPPPAVEVGGWSPTPSPASDPIVFTGTLPEVTVSAPRVESGNFLTQTKKIAFLTLPNWGWLLLLLAGVWALIKKPWETGNGRSRSNRRR